MDYSLKTRSLQSLVNDINNGRIKLSHKLQRPEGQWNRKAQSNLIDSLSAPNNFNKTLLGIIEFNNLESFN